MVVDRVSHADDMVEERQSAEEQACLVLLLSHAPRQHNVHAVDAADENAPVSQAEDGAFVKQSVL